MCFGVGGGTRASSGLVAHEHGGRTPSVDFSKGEDTDNVVSVTPERFAVLDSFVPERRGLHPPSTPGHMRLVSVESIVCDGMHSIDHP